MSWFYWYLTQYSNTNAYSIIQRMKHILKWITEMTRDTELLLRTVCSIHYSAGVAHETCRNPTWADLIHPYISIWRLKNFFKSSLYRVIKQHVVVVWDTLRLDLITDLFRYSLYMFWERSSSLLQQSQSHTELLYCLHILRCVLFKLLFLW